MPRLSWIFNYGSNHVEQLSGRIGRQISDGQRALVKGYQRVFRGWSERWGGGVGSLEAKRGAVTHGWAAKLTAAEFAKLDLHEGVASGHYARRVVKIVLPDTRKAVSGIVYVSLNEEHHAPSQAYLEACARTVGEWWSEEGRPVQPGDFPIRNNPPCPKCKAADAYKSPFSGRWECRTCDAPKVGSTASPFVGMRVRLAQDVDRYPHFVASRGRTGTVSSVDTDCIWVKMDQPLIGAEDWDNQIEWMYDNLSDFQEDVEVIGAAPARRNPPAIGRGRHVRRVIHAGHVDNGGAQIFTACGIWVAREDTNQSLDEITCRACLDEIEAARDEET